MNYLETMKNIAKDKQKRVENLIFLIILLVILLISINYIFSSDNKNSVNSTSSSSNIINKEKNIEVTNNSQTNLEEKLANILSQVNGIDDVSVLLTYSTNSKQNVVYNTKEESSDGKIVEEKTVAYNEDGTKKNAIVESVEMPKVEGAIIVAKGANTVEIKSKLATTISNVTGIPVYKVQVFEKQG